MTNSMIWLFRILTDKKLKEKEKAIRLFYLKDNQALISELRQLKLMLKTVRKEDLGNNPYLKSLYNSDFNQLIYVLEMINQCINLLWVSRKKVESLRKFTKDTREILRTLINCSKLMGVDGFATVSKNPHSIFMQLKSELDLSKFNFEFDQFSKV